MLVRLKRELFEIEGTVLLRQVGYSRLRFQTRSCCKSDLALFVLLSRSEEIFFNLLLSLYFFPLLSFSRLRLL